MPKVKWPVSDVVEQVEVSVVGSHCAPYAQLELAVCLADDNGGLAGALGASFGLHGRDARATSDSAQRELRPPKW